MALAFDIAVCTSSDRTKSKSTFFLPDSFIWYIIRLVDSGFGLFVYFRWHISRTWAAGLRTEIIIVCKSGIWYNQRNWTNDPWQKDVNVYKITIELTTNVYVRTQTQDDKQWRQRKRNCHKFSISHGHYIFRRLHIASKKNSKNSH